MKALITPNEVIALAFSSVESVSSNIINPTKIDAAEYEFIRPVLGDLYSVIGEDRYADFVTDYIKPALAYYVRFAVIPDISLQMGNTGVATFNTPYSHAASDKQREMLRQQAKSDADALMKKAVDHIESNIASFPKYTPKTNIKKTTSIKGGIII